MLYTISLWLKPTVALYNYEMYIAKFHDDGLGLGFDFGLMANGKAVLMYRNDTAQSDQLTTNTVFSLNTWVHLVVVQNGANNVYVYKMVIIWKI